ncbi:MAG: HAD hydrolase family protein, partial [Alistipes sp.]|nr:HAD hydrolase family protein [Alistipes sp.]
MHWPAARLCRGYGFEKEEAVAFGDGRNDIEMLKAVGTGVAM